jgi:hypothetical protein
LLSLSLDPTVSHANPAFRNAAGCAQWLGQLQLTNLRLAHDALRKQLDELNRCPLSGLERLGIMEQLRETVADIQTDYAGKLSAKKLPLNAGEFSILVAITGLWQSMGTGYQRCLQDYIDGEAQLADSAALLCQRCLLYGSLQIMEHVHGCYEFDGKLWQRMHALYAYSEEHQLHLQEIDHSHNATPATLSCRAVYTYTLLACYAHRAGLSRAQMQMLERWLRLWSPAVSVERNDPRNEDAAALVLDLASAQGLQNITPDNASAQVRYLPMVQISKMLRVKTILLQQGQSPQQLDLGTGGSRTDCLTLLNCLHQYWCEQPGERTARQHGVDQFARICCGMDACFAYIANRPFKQPDKVTAVDTLSRKQIATFGRVLEDTRHPDLSGLGFVCETWRIQNESLLGARLLREAGGTARIGHNQLLALRPDDADFFILATVRWMNVTLSAELQAGVRYLPGMAKAIAMKATGVNLTVSDQYVAALLLPAVPELETPASLIIPRNWFKPGLVVEIVEPEKNRLLAKMGISVDKGLDYERVSYSEI